MSDKIMSPIFHEQKSRLVYALEEMESFVCKTRFDVGNSPEESGAIHHLSMRQLMQVHVTNVLEASANYDRAVDQALSERKEG